MWNCLDVSQIILFLTSFNAFGICKIFRMKRSGSHHLFHRKVLTAPCYLRTKSNHSCVTFVGFSNLVQNKIFCIISEYIFPYASFWNTASDLLSRYDFPKSILGWIIQIFLLHMKIQILSHLQNSSWCLPSNTISSVFSFSVVKEYHI